MKEERDLRNSYRRTETIFTILFFVLGMIVGILVTALALPFIVNQIEP